MFICDVVSAIDILVSLRKYYLDCRNNLIRNGTVLEVYL